MVTNLLYLRVYWELTSDFTSSRVCACVHKTNVSERFEVSLWRGHTPSRCKPLCFVCLCAASLAVYNVRILKLHMRMVIEILPRGGDYLLFSTQNLQDSSDCAKNRAPDSSWIVIDDRIWVWSKSPSELGDRAHRSWKLPPKPLFEVDFETISLYKFI